MDHPDATPPASARDSESHFSDPSRPRDLVARQGMFGQESISSRFSSSVNSLSAWRVKVGVFVPLEEVEEPSPGEVYQVFSESELRRLEADVPCLKFGAELRVLGE